MSSELAVHVPLPPDSGRMAARRFASSPGEWLAEDARRTAGDWQAEVRLGRLRQPVLATVGTAWIDGDTVWRTLRWTPIRTVDGTRTVDERRLPSFSGQLGLIAAAGARPTLELVGSYEPPGGLLGSALDALLLRKVAEVTAVQLVGDIADRLCRPTLSADDRAADQAVAGHAQRS